ncbi:hypothetical protein FB446DRAFT_100311 [Lentinula raphanica]|nr:hypothetical protein FB446DRAFT_100311 [Lentinula raphanica]
MDWLKALRQPKFAVLVWYWFGANQLRCGTACQSSPHALDMSSPDRWHDTLRKSSRTSWSTFHLHEPCRRRCFLDSMRRNSIFGRSMESSLCIHHTFESQSLAIFDIVRYITWR